MKKTLPVPFAAILLLTASTFMAGNYSGYSQVQEICMVTSDSATLKNLVVWEKPVSAAIDSFKIYREAGASYIQIGRTAYNALSEFVDIGVNPANSLYKYKLSTIDTDGVESALSNYHQTVNLNSVWNINGPDTVGIILSWNAYVGFTFNKYYIWRSDDNGSSFSLRDSVLSNIMYYADNVPSTGSSITHFIEVKHSTGCTVTAKVKKYNASKSNTAALSVAAGIKEFYAPGFNFNIEVVPNPFTVSATLSLENMDEKNTRNLSLEIYDVLGQKIRQISVSGEQTTISRDGIESGIYFLQLKNKSGVIATRKIVIQ